MQGRSGMKDEAGTADSGQTQAMMPEQKYVYPSPGFRIGGYVIEETLGHGSMATVYLARDDSGQEVALKIFQEGPGVSATMLERFRREAEASKKLRRHPHIMTVYATGREGPYHYIAMESIKRSRTFDVALETLPFNLAETVKVAVKIARALQYAHSRGIVHRDVKPSNIMIDEFGEPLLTDFGVAELVDWPSCTITGALTGTPLYMSPEQARGERVGPASDIYSLGVVLYEAVVGVLPYSVQHRAPVNEVLKAVQQERPRRPRLFRRDINPELEAVILKALEKDPADRYPDAEAFARDLERGLAGKRVRAHHFTPVDHLSYLVRRHRQRLLAGALAAAVGLAVNVYSREQLLNARCDALVTRALLRDAERVIAEVSNGRREKGVGDLEWDELRQARRAMQGGDWARAAAHGAAAMRRSRAAGDLRVAAVAALDTARAQVMLGHRREAMAIYAGVASSPFSPRIVAAMAEWEYLVLALLEGDRQAALQMLISHPGGDEDLDLCIRCVAGDLDPAELLAGLDRFPRPFRNDACLAAALRWNLDGDMSSCRTALAACIRESAPASEWPGPLARRLRRDLVTHEGGGR